MAIKNYVIKNKRKSTCIFVMLMFLLASVFVVLHTRNTNAGVYVKDETGKYYQTNEINVLEIVAQEGQQVLGYTVKGQEPITIEKIESYDGPANLSTEDFTNATGYEVIRNMSTNEYIVAKSHLNTSFNENILGESMSDGEITIKAVPANELTTADVLWADLVYINSNDSHSNLLYYYDQVMCDGAMGIEEGDIGASYKDTYVKTELKKEIAVKAISNSAGIDNAEKFATKQMFLYLYSSNYVDNYYEFYIEMLEQAEYESLIAGSFDETYAKIEEFIAECNSEIELESYSMLEALSMKTAEYTQEDKDNIKAALKSEIYGRYYDELLEEYCIELKKYNKGILPAEINTLMSTVNGSKNLEALNNLLLYKNMANENIASGNINDAILGTDEYGLNTTDYEVLTHNFLVLDIDDVKSELVEDYIDGLLNVDFEYTEADSEKIKTLINDVNSSVASSVLEELYGCIGSEENVILFAEGAEKKFAALNATGYNSYDCQEYVDNLTTIEDTDNDGKISIEEFETYVGKFVNTIKEATYSADIKWKVAEKLYSAVGAEEVALMYNANLIGNREHEDKMCIGDYTQDLSSAEGLLNNRNNMYKMLLVLRQIRYDYYKDNVKSKIDSNGFYYKDGYDSESDTFLGEGVDSWDMYTFIEGDISDLNNRNKYREPNVVGATFNKDGVEGLAGNYVQNRVYSYMGEQFLGGANFVSADAPDTANFKSLNTAGTNYALTADNSLENPNLFVGMTKGDIIRYILEVTIMPLDTKIRVLEIQPAASEAAAGDVDDIDSQGLASEFTAKIKTCHNSWYLYADKEKSSIVASASNKSTWKFKRNTDGTYCVYHVGTDNQAMDISGGKTDPGTDVLVWGYHGDSNQKWKIIKKGSGYSFISAKSDTCALDQDLTNPSNMQIYTTSDNKAQQFILEDIKVTSGGAGKRKLLEYMGMDTARADLVDITSMSVKEFNTRNEDLISNYDLIYFGLDSGYQVLKDFGGIKRTRYNDTDMTGLVYTGIGDKYAVQDHLRGTTAVDYYRVESELPMEFTAYIQSVFNERYLHVSENSRGNEVKAKSGERSLWRFKYDTSKKAYSIFLEESYGTNSQLVMGLKDGSTSNGTRVTLRSYTDDKAKRWTIEQNRSGYKIIPQKATGSAMDKDADAGKDEVIQIYQSVEANKNHSARQFRFEIVDVFNSSTVTLGGQKATNYSTYDYWYKNFTHPFKNNSISSWNLDFSNTNRWFLKSGSMDYATTRLLGNDITVKRMNDLMEYVKAGYPIMLPEAIYYCDTDKYVSYKGNEANSNAEKWRYVDVNSKLYNFVKTIKTLGYDANLNVYTGLDEKGEKIFDDGYKYANIVIDKSDYAKYGRNPENLPTESKFEGGLKYAIKRSARVDFELISCPTEYNKTKDANGLGKLIKSYEPEYKSFKFELKLVSTSKSMEWVKENYSFKILIDRAGTGRFEDRYVAEIEPSNIVFDMKENIVTLTGNWPGSMEGFMPWKVVAYSKNNPNSSYTYSGFSAFEISSRKDIYALWIKTGSNLDFQNLVNYYQNDVLGDTREYDINLITLSLSDFTKLWSGESATTTYNKKNTKLKVSTVLNKYSSASKSSGFVTPDASREFDILIFGYTDSFNGLDVENLAAQRNIDYFVNTAKKSILYVHDNNSYLMTLNYYIYEYKNGAGDDVSQKKVDSGVNWGRYNTAFLRDTIGQDAFGITYAPSVFDESSPNYDPNIANTRKYINSTNQEDYRGISEVCTFIYENSQNYNGKQGNDLYSSTIHGTSATGITGWQHTNTVSNMNKGQLTEYPFIIGNEIDVSKTHSQYAMLNLEDEELTVWYTLGHSDSKSGDKPYYKYTKGDGANNFFIYSKENVTYTGAGHESGATDLEKKLFFNTVIASIKAGNFDPTLDFSGASVDSNGDYYVNHVGDEDVMITFKATDYDAKKGLAKTFTESKIFLDVNKNNKFDKTTDTLLYDYEDGASVSQIHSTNKDTAGNYILMKDELRGEKIINAQYYSFILTNSVINQINASLAAVGGNIYGYPIVIEVTDAGIDGDAETKTTVFNRIFLKRIENDEPSIYGLD